MRQLAQLPESIPQSWIIGLLPECLDVEGWVAGRNFVSQRSEARVVEPSRSQQVSARRFYEFEVVAWVHAHRIKDVRRDSDLVLHVNCDDTLRAIRDWI